MMLNRSYSVMRILVLLYLLFQLSNSLFSFPFLSFFYLFIYFIFLLWMGWLDWKIGALHPDEQTILANWYNSLSNKGGLNWNTTNDLCGQSGVTCESSSLQRVSQLYFIFLSFFFKISLVISFSQNIPLK